MTIRFKCANCQKPLAVKDHLAGKKAACPVCKTALTVPAPVAQAADVEALAAAALAEKPAEQPADAAASKPIDFPCPYCGEDLHLSADLGGKQTSCPECRRIIKVPLPKVEKPKDWRDLAKQGPTAALINLPEQLPDAWGTEQKTKVSSTALDKADAIEYEEEPVGVLGWLRRGFYLALVVGLGYLAYVGISYSRVVKNEKDVVKETLAALKEDLPPLFRGELHRALGEIYLGQGKVAEAHKHFGKARLEFMQADSAGPERDYLLMELVLSQVGLGGSDDEEARKERFSWKGAKEVPQNEMRKTLEAMLRAEVRSVALRGLSTKLGEANKLEIALGLAANLANAPGGRVPFLAQQVALQLELKDDKAAANALAPPEPDKDVSDGLARMAYAEGYVRRGDLKKALAVVRAEGGEPADRAEAALAGAAVILADLKQPASAAAPFVHVALTAADEMGDKVPSWLLFELIRCSARANETAKVKDALAKLPTTWQARAHLEVLKAKLSRSQSAAQTAMLIGIDEPVPRALAVEALARHNARLGFTQEEDVDEAFRPFLRIGEALGKQDARK